MPLGCSHRRRRFGYRKNKRPCASITVTVTNNTAEPAGGAILNANTWTSLTIVPGGGAWTISGSITPGLPLIDLNGADNVTIDGLGYRKNKRPLFID
jgi:predicted outer membrane repeat protein